MIAVFDLDGTLCFDGKSISQGLQKNLKELSNQGYELIFASARPIRDMLPLLDHFPDQFLIGGNGSIVRKSGQIEVVQAISQQDFEKIKALIDQYDLDYLVDSDWNYALRNRDDHLAQLHDKVDANQLAKNVPLTTLSKIIKCNLVNLQNPVALLTVLSNLSVEMVQHEKTSSLDLTAKNINKYTTFRNYFPTETYIAFGNDANDVTLLKNAKQSVAVGKNPILDFADFKVSAAHLSQFIEEKKWQK